MKKIMQLVVIMLVLVACCASFTLATSSGKYIEICYSAEELVNWIQTADFDTWYGAGFRDSITSLRENGNLLIPSYGEAKLEEIKVDLQGTPGSGVNWDDLQCRIRYIFSNGATISVFFIPEHERHIAERGIVDYFEEGIGYGFSMYYDTTVYKETLLSGEEISYVKRGGDAYCLLKDDFAVYIDVWQDDVNAFIKDLSLELVSLKGVAWELESEFTDVEKDKWYYSDIEYAAGKRFMNGIGNGDRFYPELPATRDTAAYALWCSKERPYPSSDENGFEDVPDTKENWHIAWATEKGIVNGVGDNKFMPDGNITRQDFATMVIRYLDHIGYEYVLTAEYRAFADDAQIADYAKDAVQTLTKLGVIKGKENNMFDPHGNVTRAETAAILHRLMDLVANKK